MDLFDRAAWKKDREARAIVKRGHATLKELITLNYDEWPLRGLDIVTDEHLDQEVRIAPMRHYLGKILTDPNLSFFARTRYFLLGAKTVANSLGLATAGNDREIYLNKILIKYEFLKTGNMLTNHILAHERRHVHQFDDVIQNRSDGLYGRAKRAEDTTTADRAVEQLIADSLKDMSTIRRAWVKFENRAAQKMRSITGGGYGKYYYRQGREIQARLEEVLVKGYSHWPHMPLNREQLYAAAMDAGLEPPTPLAADLTKNPVFVEARNQFKSNAFKHQGAPPGLARAINELPTKRAKEQFWRETLPILYADILESFGDREGRARMNLGVNIVLPDLLFGKDFVKCYDENPGQEVYKKISDSAVRFGSPDAAAGYITGFFQREIEQREIGGPTNVAEGTKRFILAFIEAPGVKDSLVEHKSSLVTWIEDGALRRPPDPSATSSPQSLHS